MTDVSKQTPMMKQYWRFKAETVVPYTEWVTHGDDDVRLGPTGSWAIAL